ncbi:MAG: hypothetical protein H6744_14625 [Deltaproteobacteria bacterium]|nr:hypothetical protein [Deltaproteobacteria bacterium]
MLSATAGEARAAIDCSTVNPGGVIWGSAGLGSTGATGTVKVNPGITCVAMGNTGYSPSGTTDLPLGNIDGTTGCEQVVNVQGTLSFPSTFTYPADSTLGVECIRGSFSMVGSNYALVAANALADVGDDILIQNNPGLLAITFNGLVTLGTAGTSNDISIKSNASLGDAQFNALTLIFGKLEIISNGTWGDLTGFGALTAIGNSLEISNNDMLDLLQGEFPALTVIDGSLKVSGNDIMTTLALPALGGISARLTSPGLTINANDLMVLDLSGLVVMPRSVAISSEPNLMDAGITPWALGAIGGSLTFSNNLSLDNLNAFASIATIAGDLNIDNNDALTSITGIASITALGGALLVRGNSSLTAVTFPTITTATRIELRDNDLMATLGFPSLLTLTTELRVHGLIALPDIGITTTGFPVLANLGTQFYMHATSNLTGLSFPSLAATGWRFWLSSNDDLAVLDFPALATIGGELHLDDNPALTAVGGPLVGDFGFPALVSTEGKIFVENNTTLGYFRLPSLTTLSTAATTVASPISVRFNTAMTRFVIDNAADLAGICSGPPLVFNAASVSTITGKANLGACTDLASLAGCLGGTATCVP